MVLPSCKAKGYITFLMIPRDIEPSFQDRSSTKFLVAKGKWQSGFISKFCWLASYYLCMTVLPGTKPVQTGISNDVRSLQVSEGCLYGLSLTAHDSRRECSAKISCYLSSYKGRHLPSCYPHKAKVGPYGCDVHQTSAQQNTEGIQPQEQTQVDEQACHII